MGEPTDSDIGENQEERMDDLTRRLHAGAVLAQTRGSLAPMPWANAQRSDLSDGVLAIVDDPQERLMAFVPRGGGLALVLPVSSITSATKRASALNTVVDVDIGDHGDRETICIVGPRGRMKRIFAAAGHTL
jgi:hypothetical protein